MNKVIGIAALASTLFAPIGAMADEKLDKVAAIFKVQYASFCDTLRPESMPTSPIATEFSFSYSYKNAPKENNIWTLYEFPCTQGAYNFGSVFYTHDNYEEIRAVHFAYPQPDITNADPDDYESDVVDIKIKGYSTQDVLFFVDFDPETLMLKHTVHWRGLGDASEGGTWKFENGGFVLVQYQYDASYDGEVNPIIVYPAR